MLMQIDFTLNFVGDGLRLSDIAWKRVQIKRDLLEMASILFAWVFTSTKMWSWMSWWISEDISLCNSVIHTHNEAGSLSSISSEAFLWNSIGNNLTSTEVWMSIQITDDCFSHRKHRRFIMAKQNCLVAHISVRYEARMKNKSKNQDLFVH